MNHFLDISQLSRKKIESILQRALYFKIITNTLLMRITLWRIYFMKTVRALV